MPSTKQKERLMQDAQCRMSTNLFHIKPQEQIRQRKRIKKQDIKEKVKKKDKTISISLTTTLHIVLFPNTFISNPIEARNQLKNLRDKWI